MLRATDVVLDKLKNLRLDPDMPPPDIRGHMMRVPRHLNARSIPPEPVQKAPLSRAPTRRAQYAVAFLGGNRRGIGGRLAPRSLSADHAGERLGPPQGRRHQLARGQSLARDLGTEPA